MNQELLFLDYYYVFYIHNSRMLHGPKDVLCERFHEPKAHHQLDQMEIYEKNQLYYLFQMLLEVF